MKEAAESQVNNAFDIANKSRQKAKKIGQKAFLKRWNANLFIVSTSFQIF